jgi:hypothetical protein
MIESTPAVTSKVCIWCRQAEPTITFNRDAHIFPRSLAENDYAKMFVMTAIPISDPSKRVLPL